MVFCREANEALRKATQMRENGLTAMLINVLLEQALTTGNVQRATTLCELVVFPLGKCTSSDEARFLYYSGVVHAINKKYGAAEDFFRDALAKVPQGVGGGFCATVAKWYSLSQVAAGSIPRVSLFRDVVERAGLDKRRVSMYLSPYARLIAAVRSGDMARYSAVFERHRDVFSADSLVLTLVTRLRHVVYPVGLLKICSSYSRISMDDVATRLGVQPEEAMLIVVDAIQDGIISSEVEPQTRTLVTKTEKAKSASLAAFMAFDEANVALREFRTRAEEALRFGPRAHRAKHKSELQEEVEKYDRMRNMGDSGDEYDSYDEHDDF